MDLWGRLSNPSEILEKLADQGWSGPARPPGTVVGFLEGPDSGLAAMSPEQKGRLSNPVQRRLSPAENTRLVETYIAGSSIDAAARQHQVHRTTVMTHLQNRNIPRRANLRKMTKDTVARAGRRYASGVSLAAVAAEFRVHERTLVRELRRKGVPIRRRNGWPPPA